MKIGGATLSLPDPLHSPIFDMKITLGSLVVIVFGVVTIAGATYAGTQWVDSVNNHLTSLDREIGYLRTDVGNISNRLEQWHMTNPEKRTELDPNKVGVP